MSKYRMSNMEYAVNKVEVNKPKLASIEIMEFIKNSTDSEIFVEDVPTLNQSEYIVEFQEGKKTTYEDYLELLDLLTGIVNFKPLSRGEWGRG